MLCGESIVSLPEILLCSGQQPISEHHLDARKGTVLHCQALCLGLAAQLLSLHLEPHLAALLLSCKCRQQCVTNDHLLCCKDPEQEGFDMADRHATALGHLLIDHPYGRQSGTHLHRTSDCHQLQALLKLPIRVLNHQLHI